MNEPTADAMQGFIINSLADLPNDAWGFVVLQLPQVTIIVPCESEEESVQTRSALQSNGGKLSVWRSAADFALPPTLYVYFPHGLLAPDQLSSKHAAWVEAARAVAPPAELEIQNVHVKKRQRTRQSVLSNGIIRAMNMLAALPPVAAPIVRIVFPVLQGLFYRIQMHDIKATVITSPEELPQDAWGFVVREYAPRKFFVFPCESQEQAERHRLRSVGRGEDANVYQTVPDEVFRGEVCLYGAYLKRNVSPKRAAWIKAMREHERERLRRKLEASLRRMRS